MRFPFECGPLVKCLDGQPRKAFSVSLYIDESMRKEKAIAPAGEEKELPKEMTLDDILDLKDLITQPPTMSTGRGKELLVEEGTIFFLEVQNRDPKTQAHVTIMMNTDVQVSSAEYGSEHSLLLSSSIRQGAPKPRSVLACPLSTPPTTPVHRVYGGCVQTRSLTSATPHLATRLTAASGKWVQRRR